VKLETGERLVIAEVLNGQADDDGYSACLGILACMEKSGLDRLTGETIMAPAPEYREAGGGSPSRVLEPRRRRLDKRALKVHGPPYRFKIWSVRWQRLAIVRLRDSGGWSRKKTVVHRTALALCFAHSVQATRSASQRLQIAYRGRR
jgi:hypothetical protein